MATTYLTGATDIDCRGRLTSLVFTGNSPGSSSFFARPPFGFWYGYSAWGTSGTPNFDRIPQIMGTRLLPSDKRELPDKGQRVLLYNQAVQYRARGGPRPGRTTLGTRYVFTCCYRNDTTTTMEARIVTTGMNSTPVSTGRSSAGVRASVTVFTGQLTAPTDSQPWHLNGNTYYGSSQWQDAGNLTIHEFVVGQRWTNNSDFVTECRLPFRERLIQMNTPDDTFERGCEVCFKGTCLAY